MFVRSLTPFRPTVASSHVACMYSITPPSLGQRRNPIESQTTSFPTFCSRPCREASRYALSNPHPCHSVGAMSAHHGLHRHATSRSGGSHGVLSHHTHTVTSGGANNNRQSTTSFHSIVRPQFWERNFGSTSSNRIHAWVHLSAI